MRTRLLAAARHLFVLSGFDGTSTPAIVTEAGVTRGALYHHFADKRAIFRGVVEAESKAVARAIETADPTGKTALDNLLRGAKAYISAMAVDGRVRLLLIEGPAVLGPDIMREIEGANAEASLRQGLTDAIAEGALPAQPVEPLASLLSAMFERAAMDVANGTDTARVEQVIERLLRGIAVKELPTSITEAP